MSKRKYKIEIDMNDKIENFFIQDDLIIFQTSYGYIHNFITRVANERNLNEFIEALRNPFGNGVIATAEEKEGNAGRRYIADTNDFKNMAIERKSTKFLDFKLAFFLETNKEVILHQLKVKKNVDISNGWIPELKLEDMKQIKIWALHLDGKTIKTK